MQPGAVLDGRFVIVRLAETGGAGLVYEATDKTTGQAAAIKVLRLEDPEAGERFAREVRTLSQLDHPAIVRYLGHGKTQLGAAFVALEWVAGETLNQRLTREKLSVAQALTLGRRVAEGLAYAHGREVVHRDISAANLVIPSGRLEDTKIVDFGLVRLSEPVVTLSGTVLGTPGYMAPEQARGEDDVDARADVFALGCVLFKALTGQAPFEGTVVARLAKVLFEAAPRVQRLRPDVPWAIDDLIARMLSRDRDERPADGAAVLSELAPLHEGLPTERSVQTATPWEGTLTIDEQRLVSIVVVLGSARHHDAGAAQRAKNVGAPFGARVELLADGTVMAALWSKGSARDQAKQAARCALALRDIVEDAAIALATGRAALGASGLIGEVIERASVLVRTQEYKGGTLRRRPIAVDATTAGLLDAQFDVAGEGSQLGLRRERPKPAEAARTLLGRPTPFVGRERELATIEAAFRGCIEDGVAHALLVTGAAGAGKSRLRRELCARIRSREERWEIWIAHGDPMSAGSPLGMIAQIVRVAAAVTESEPLRARQAKLAARLSRNLSGEKLTRVTEFLGEAAGIRFPEGSSVELRAARRNSVLMGDQMRRAFEDFLAAECDAQPVLIVLEDLHWGDLPTVTFLDGALRLLRDKPLVVLALAHSEVHRLFPQLWAGHPTTEIRLGELSKKACEKLARQVLGDRATDQNVALIVERAAGNAFYLEELIRSVAEGQEQLPSTVLAMVEARLAALDPESRRLLRAASVFGGTFWKGGVATLLDQPPTALSSQLEELVKRELILSRDPGRFPEEFHFRHAIVRDAAYGTLTDADRKLGHRLAGAWLEEAGETDAMVLAEQFERGGEVERAAEWYERAAKQAFEGNDFEVAIARVRTAIANGATGESLGRLLVIEAQARRWRGEFAEVNACLKQALEALPRGTPEWYEAAGAALSTSVHLGKYEDLVALVDSLCDAPEKASPVQVAAWTRALAPLTFEGFGELAAKLFACLDRAPVDMRDPSVAARIHQARATKALTTGDPCAYLESTEAAARAFEVAGDLRNASVQKSHAGYAKTRLGAYAAAEATLREALTTAERLGLPTVAAVARQNLGITLAYRGALYEARAAEEQAVESALAENRKFAVAGTKIYLAEILALGRNYEAAERVVREALAIATDRTHEVRQYALALLGQILLATKRPDEALEQARAATALLAKTGSVTESGGLVRLTFAEALDATGDSAAARAAIKDAREQLLARADRISDAALRQTFLEKVTANARTLKLAEAWG